MFKVTSNAAQVIENLVKRRQSFDIIVEDALNNAVQSGADQLKDDCPVDSGNTAASIRSEKIADLSYGIYANKIFGWQSYGTHPHIITAVNAKMLRFFVGGSPIYRKSVMHPGLEPKHLVEKAFPVVYGTFYETVHVYMGLTA